MVYRPPNLTLWYLIFLYQRKINFSLQGANNEEKVEKNWYELPGHTKWYKTVESVATRQPCGGGKTESRENI